MALSRRSIIDSIEITRPGDIQIRIKKQIVDGDVVVSQENHRTSIAVGSDIERQMKFVDDHLGILGAAALDASEWAYVREIAAVAWNPSDESSAVFSEQQAVAMAREAAVDELRANAVVLSLENETLREELARLSK